MYSPFSDTVTQKIDFTAYGIYRHTASVGVIEIQIYIRASTKPVKYYFIIMVTIRLKVKSDNVLTLVYKGFLKIRCCFPWNRPK